MNLPNYLSTPSAIKKSTVRATSSARQEAELEAMKIMEEQFSEDVIDTLKCLSSKFRSSNDTEFKLYFEGEDYLLFTAISSNDMPMLSSVNVSSNLSFSASYYGKGILSSRYSSVMEFSRQILRYSDFILTY